MGDCYIPLRMPNHESASVQCRDPALEVQLIRLMGSGIGPVGHESDNDGDYVLDDIGGCLQRRAAVRYQPAQGEQQLKPDGSWTH